MNLLRGTSSRLSAILGGCVVLALGVPASAFEPTFPANATVTANLQESLTSYRMPIGPFDQGAMQTRLVEGAKDQTAWRLAAPGTSTLALLQPLRDQLAAEGWTILFECETDACGGFDFRYGTDVLPEPDMHVDLGDFRYLAAERAGPAEAISLMVSRSAESGFVQVIHMGPARPDVPLAETPTDPLPAPALPELAPAPVAPAVATGDIGQRLESSGTVPLDDLVFPSGASTLAEGDYASLAALAEYLKARPDARIALVGHTDASGALEANIALSRKRAASVRDRLVKSYGVTPARIVAEGVGFLAPRATNLTEAGRTANRRVEVMLTSTQ